MPIFNKTVMEENKIIAYKGFDKNLCCRNFQYEIGKEYFQEGEIERYKNGFHACTNPIEVLDCYEADHRSRFCVVEQSGVISRDSVSSTQASSKIRIVAEIGIAGLFKAAVELLEKETDPMPVIKETEDKEGGADEDDALIGSSCEEDHICSKGDDVMIGSSGGYAHIGSSGDSVQIGSSGYDAQIASSGNYALIGSNNCEAWIGSSGNTDHIGSSGDYAHISSSGNYALILSSGLYAQIGSSGNYAHIGSSGDCALISSSGAESKIGASGRFAQISSSGGCVFIGSSSDYAHIGSSGDCAQIESTGEASVMCCSGYNSMVRAKKGSWITLTEWKYSGEKKAAVPVCVKTEYVDGERIKEDTWYKIVDGEFVEYNKYGD